jgi:hypothetical protein
MIINDQFFAVLNGAIVACEVLELLPESDLIDQLADILTIQREILTHIIEGRHYGSNNLDNYCDHINAIWTEVKRLNESSKEG